MSDSAPAVSGTLRSREQLRTHLADFEAMQTRFIEDLRRANAATHQSLAELAAHLLPSLAPDGLQRLVDMLGLADLDPDIVTATATQHRAVLEQRLASTRADPRYATVNTALEENLVRRTELAQHLPVLRESVQMVSRDADLSTYLGGVDESAWWTFAYHRSRDAGERLVRRYGSGLKASTPEQLWQRHRREREALLTLEAELRSITAEGEELKGLLREEAWLLEMLRTLEQRQLTSLQARVRAHCEALSDLDLLRVFAGQAAEVRARKVSGCRARARYLESLFDHFVDRRRGALLARLQDLEFRLEEEQTAGRSSAGHTRPEVDLLLMRDQRAHDDARNTYDAAVSRLFQFAGWGSCDPSTGGLWWDAFMGGTIDGSFIDEVTWHLSQREAPVPRWARREGSAAPGSANLSHAAARLEAAYASVHRGASPSPSEVTARRMPEPAVSPARGAPAPVCFDDE